MPDGTLPDLDETAVGLIQLTVGRESFPNLIYIVHDHTSGDAVVVDPGWDADLVCTVIAERGLTLRGIVVTHSHRDHTGAVAALSDMADVPVYASQGCLASIGLPDHRCCIIAKDSDLHLGSVTVRALLTPGHTSCSVSFLIGNCLFPGDTIFIEGCGLATSPGGDAAELYRSCARLKAVVPGTALVFPGHQYGRPVGASFAHVRETNFYLRLGNEGSFVTFCNRARGNREPPVVGTVPEMTASVRDLLYATPKEAIRSCQMLPSSNRPGIAEPFRLQPTPP